MELTTRFSAARTGAGSALQHGPPHLLLGHNPDCFYESSSLWYSTDPVRPYSRWPGFDLGEPTIIRHSRFCLDEGAYAYDDALLVVSRGLGSVGLPWRHGANPEAVMIEIPCNPRIAAGVTTYLAHKGREGNFEIGRILHLKSETRNLRLDGQA